MVAHRPLTPKTERYPLPPDGPLMARLRIHNDVRLAFGVKSEDQDQRALKIYLDARRFVWFHYPAEAKRDAAERGSALARGLKSGVSDIIIMEPFVVDGVQYEDLHIELKRADKTACDVSDEQREWIDKARTRRRMAEWCRGEAEAKALIEACYGPPPPPPPTPLELLFRKGGR